jgi:hypothetical protein
MITAIRKQRPGANFSRNWKWIHFGSSAKFISGKALTAQPEQNWAKIVVFSDQGNISNLAQHF